MGKRYGRNQKRRHLAKIADMEARADARERLINDQARNYRALDSLFTELVRAIEQVAPFSICTPVREIFTRMRYLPPVMHIQLQQPMHMSIPYGPQDAYEAVTVDIEKLYRFEALVADDWKNWGTRIHARYHGTGEEVGYYISKDAWETRVPFEELVYMIAQEMRNHINKKRRAAYAGKM